MISVFDGETERKLMMIEKVGFSIFLIIVAPVALVVILLTLYTILLFLDIARK